MTVRRKAILLLVGLLTGLYGVLYVSANLVFLRSFEDVERQRAIEEAHRAADAIENELVLLSSSDKDWASWNATYSFMKDRNQAFIQENLDFGTLSNLNINAMLCLDTNGRPVFAYEQASGQKTHKKMLPEDILTVANACKHDDIEQNSSGVIYLRGMPVLIVTSPIVKSDGTGEARGTLLMARYVDRLKLKNCRLY